MNRSMFVCLLALVGPVAACGKDQIPIDDFAKEYTKEVCSYFVRCQYARPGDLPRHVRFHRL